MKRALLLIDLQNDFCPGGALAVSEGDATIAVANRAIAACCQRDICVIASQDWHPIDHGSFAINSNAETGTLGELHGLPQVWWPVHCVQHQSGATFHPQLNQQDIVRVFRKGQNPRIDSYSAFFDNARSGKTGLDDWLRQQEIGYLSIMGLATDYCVKFSVLDALELGYRVEVIADGCRGVNLRPEDSQRALDEMARRGASIIQLEQFLRQKE